MQISQPPSDENGNITPHNHPEISSVDGAIRRISDQQIIDKNGKRYISSIAFKGSSGPNGGMSVDLQNLIEAAGLDPQVHVTTPRWFGSVRFEVGFLRKEDFLVGYNPVIGNPYHGEVWGAFTKTQRRKLQESAVWFVEIRGVFISAG